MAASDFKLRAAMVAGFAVTEFRPEAVLRQVLQHWGNEFNGEVVSLPLPTLVPTEVPAAILSSSDGTLRAEIARSRVNLHWLPKDGTQQQFQQVVKIFAQRLAEISAENTISLGRLGVVATHQSEASDPGIMLARRFCNEGFLRHLEHDPKGFEIHVHTIFLLSEDVRVNHWTRVRTAQDTTREYRSITVEQDINTLPEESETRRFSSESGVEFCGRAAQRMEATLGSYFGSGAPTVA